MLKIFSKKCAKPKKKSHRSTPINIRSIFLIDQMRIIVVVYRQTLVDTVTNVQSVSRGTWLELVSCIVIRTYTDEFTASHLWPSKAFPLQLISVLLEHFVVRPCQHFIPTFESLTQGGPFDVNVLHFIAHQTTISGALIEMLMGVIHIRSFTADVTVHSAGEESSCFDF